MFFKILRHIAGRASLRSIERQLENTNTYIITLGLCVGTTQLVRTVEKEMRKRWLTQATVCIVYPMAIAIVILCVILAGHQEAEKPVAAQALPPHILLYMPKLNSTDFGGGGGGGGKKSRAPASAGRLPDIKRVQLAPPSATPPKKEPEIPEPVSLEGAIDASQIPIPALPNVMGDAVSPIPNPPSDGEGAMGGIGAGNGTGIGSGNGGGYGPGEGGGTGGGAGGGIGSEFGKGRSDTRAVIVSHPDPPKDTDNYELNRAILKFRGKKLYFAVRATLNGAVEDTHVFSGPGDETFNRLLMEHIRNAWKVYAVRAVKGTDGKQREEYVNDWVLVIMQF